MCAVLETSSNCCSLANFKSAGLHAATVMDFETVRHSTLGLS